MERRVFLASMATTLASAASQLPANKNIKWAVSAGLWGHYPQSPFTDILDVMRDTGFIGVRLTGYPGILKQYNLTAAQLEREVSKRNLAVCTISFGGPVNDPAQHDKVVEKGAGSHALSANLRREASGGLSAQPHEAGSGRRGRLSGHVRGLQSDRRGG